MSILRIVVAFQTINFAFLTLKRAAGRVVRGFRALALTWCISRIVRFCDINFQFSAIFALSGIWALCKMAPVSVVTAPVKRAWAMR